LRHFYSFEFLTIILSQALARQVYCLYLRMLFFSLLSVVCSFINYYLHIQFLIYLIGEMNKFIKLNDREIEDILIVIPTYFIFMLITMFLLLLCLLCYTYVIFMLITMFLIKVLLYDKL